MLITDLDADLAAEAAAAVDGETAVFGGDLTKDGVPEDVVRTAVEAFGQLDIVVNNAGYTWDGMAHKMSDEQFRNARDPHRCPVQAPARRRPVPARRGQGADREAGREVFRKVVNVTSISGTQGNLGQVNYFRPRRRAWWASTKTLAREWGAFKVNVNAVAFGFVETRLTASDDGGEHFVKDGVEIALGIPEKMRQLAPTIIPPGPGDPEDAAGPIFFLCSPWSNFVHGQVLTASGGQTTGMTS